MATRNRQGFEDLGREHAMAGNVRRYKVADASWQARAYNTGWDIGKGELNVEAQPRNSGQTTFKAAYVGSIRPLGKSIVNRVAIAHAVVTQPKKPKDEGVQIWFDELQHLPIGDNRGINMERMAANTKGWPPAAAEHVLFLAKQANMETNPVRRARLERAICRLQTRHMKTATP